MLKSWKVLITALFVCTVASVGAMANVGGDAIDSLPFPTCSVSADAELPAVPPQQTAPSFCDDSPDHGTSKSCKEFGRANGQITCPNGQYIANLNCSVGQTCDSGNGHWCNDCSWECKNKKTLPADTEEPF